MPNRGHLYAAQEHNNNGADDDQSGILVAASAPIDTNDDSRRGGASRAIGEGTECSCHCTAEATCACRAPEMCVGSLAGRWEPGRCCRVQQAANVDASHHPEQPLALPMARPQAPSQDWPLGAAPERLR